MGDFSVKDNLINVFSSFAGLICRERNGDGLHTPVLCYHRVLPDFVNDNPRVFSISPAMFSSQMEYLQKNDFRSLALDEFSEICKGRRQAPERSVLVSFDDWYADIFRVAFPVCQTYGIKMNVFISTSYIGKAGPSITGAKTTFTDEHTRRYPDLWKSLTWEEVKAMKAAGAGVGCHGHTHANLANLSVPDLRKEIDLTVRTFTRNLGYEPNAIAIPYGSTAAYNQQVIDMVNEAGIEMIFSTLSGRVSLKHPQSPLPRFVIKQSDTLNTFRMKLLGALDWITPLRNTIKSLR